MKRENPKSMTYLNAPLLTIGLALMFMALFGLGLIMNAITFTLRGRTYTANTLSVILLVFSGIVCPIKLMHEWAQVVSEVVPFSYRLDILRSALILRSEMANVTSCLVDMILSFFYVTIEIALLERIGKNVKRKAFTFHKQAQHMTW